MADSISWDGEYTESTEEVNESDDLDTEDKMFRVAEMTTEDGTTLCEVRDFEDDGAGTMTVEGMTPTGETFEEEMEVPGSDSTEHKFVRICQDAGFDLKTSGQIIGEYVHAEKEDGEWEFAPKEDQPLISPVAIKVVKGTVAFLALPLTTLYVSISGKYDVMGSEDTLGEALFFGVLILLLSHAVWGLAWMILIAIGGSLWGVIA